MFLLGVVYCLMQSILSAWMYPWHNGKVIVAVRAVITTIAVTTAITSELQFVTFMFFSISHQLSRFLIVCQIGLNNSITSMNA